ncbi:MAG: hypothetical protein OSP8Acid_01440 [uncultured Acidilobus sp. OSP8]|jgi:hypothetical protein|nr:MAG: hypothetical protein OSP8Acid_01440 [uncultured Acidilobus sp. OSP8]
MARELLDYHDEASAAKRAECARRAFERAKGLLTSSP